MNSYILAFLLLFTVLSSSLLPDSHSNPKSGKAGTAKIVFKSTDGGQTWQDISQGLPENLQKDSIRGNSFFANDNGLYFKAGDGLYHNKPNATPPFWTKEIFPGEGSSIVPGKSMLFYWGVNLRTTNGTSVWSPIFENLQGPRLRSAFESAGGALFVGTDTGIYKTVDHGKTWKLVYAGGLVGHLAESDGVLLAITMKKIIRSTDNGETWAPTTSEDSMALDVKPIKGGFAALTRNSESNTLRLSTSYDGGKTWQSVHSRLQDKGALDYIRRNWNNRPQVKTFMTSIIQVGEDLICAHPAGIFRSSDKGKTWKFLLPSVDGKVFNLFVSGNVVYAVPSRGGC